MNKSIMISRIDNGYLVQEMYLPGSVGFGPPLVKYCKDLDEVFALVELIMIPRRGPELRYQEGG